MLPIEDLILVMPQLAMMLKKGALLLCRVAQMNQTMVKMNTTMSLTAIDKRLMMRQVIALALLALSLNFPLLHLAPVYELDVKSSAFS
jgi:hypothetical protein